MAVLALILFFAACKRSQSELGKLAAKTSGNKIFKEIEEDTFAEKLKEMSGKQSNQFKNPNF